MDAALGLKYMHGENTVHSGVSGDNLLVRENGRGVLGGFGLTKVRPFVLRDYA
jgi:serine/threonine protein kinase